MRSLRVQLQHMLASPKAVRGRRSSNLPTSKPYACQASGAFLQGVNERLDHVHNDLINDIGSV